LDELFAAAAMLGITIVCASGDFGPAADGLLIAPASSPLALACGATQIDDGGNERVWDRSGGGTSTRAARATPDLAALMTFPVWMDGVPLVAGGTSAVAPFVAAVIARLNQRSGIRYGFFAPLLYSAQGRQSCFRAIAAGDATAAGWNSRSGLGAPRFDEIEKLLT
jgi:kumamolisin